MPICCSCRKEIPDGSNFCPYCGKKCEMSENKPVICKNCNTINSKEYKYCYVCGKELLSFMIAPNVLGNFTGKDISIEEL